MIKKIVDVNSNLKLVQNMKSATFLHLYTFLSFSIIVLLTSYFLTTWLWEKGWMSTLTITIAAIGLGLIPLAVAPLNKYKRRINIAKNDINKVNSLLSIYNIDYSIEIALLKGPHDSVDIETELSIIINNKKETHHFKKNNAGTTIDY